MARRLLGLLWALGAAALCAWAVQYDGPFLWRTAALTVAVLVAGLAALHASRLGEGAELRWDGQHWALSGRPAIGTATASVHLDLQSLMLVRVQARGRAAAWLWLERSAFPARWLDVRRALHASRPQPGATDVPEALVRP